MPDTAVIKAQALLQEALKSERTRARKEYLEQVARAYRAKAQDVISEFITLCALCRLTNTPINARIILPRGLITQLDPNISDEVFERCVERKRKNLEDTL